MALPSGGVGLPKPGKLSTTAFNKAFNAKFNTKFNAAYAAKASLPKPPAPPKPPGLVASQLHADQALAQNVQNQNVQRQSTLPGARPATSLPAAAPKPAAPRPNTQTQGSPLDATYYNNVADNLFKVQNSINALGLQRNAASTSLQNTLAQLRYAQPRADLALEQKFNNAGGLYSSAENQGIGNLNYTYLGKEGAAQSKYDSTANTIAAKIAALQGSIQPYNNAQAIAAAARQAKLAQTAAPPPPNAASPAAAPTAARAPAKAAPVRTVVRRAAQADRNLAARVQAANRRRQAARGAKKARKR